MKYTDRMAMLLIVLILLSELVCGIPNFPTVIYDIDRIPSNVRDKLNRIDDAQYLQAATLALNSVHQDAQFEIRLRSNGISVGESSESYAQMLESAANEESQKLDQMAKEVIKSNSYFVNRYCIPENIDAHVCGQYLSTKLLPLNSSIYKKCSSTEHRKKYAFTRLLPARYKDGIYQMFNEPIVPRPRRIARNKGNTTRAEKKHPEYNLLLMQWTQFIEHDLSKPVSTTMSNGDPIECCTTDNYLLSPRYVHPACAPLEGNEPRNEYTHVSCQNYVRNAQTVNSQCKFGPAVMLNQENGILDLSQLYGLYPRSQNRMRLFRDGLLRSSSSLDIKTSMLPFTNSSAKFCLGSSYKNCFMAGDSRVNSNPFITQLYTIFLRSHNLIAQQLKVKNPNYNDEKLFTQAKERNIAEYNAIIFDSWLPAVLGSQLARSIRNLKSDSTDGISSELGVAAIRFYYSMMPDNVSLVGHCVTGSLDISKHFYNSDFLNKDCALSSLLLGMLNSNIHKADIYYKSIVLENCLKSKEENVGVNCLALDIQRGRDHGLASYTNYLERCTGVQIQSWNALEPFIDMQELENLKDLYTNVGDIDLLIGAMSERPTDGLLGVTFSCIIADQFAKMWSQIEENAQFNAADTIGAQLLCRTTGLDAVPYNIYKVMSDRNKLINCSDIFNQLNLI